MKRKFIRKKKTGTTSKVGEECDSEIPRFDFTELNDASHEVEDKSVDESVGSENGESEDKNEGEDGKQKSQKKDQNKLSLTEGDAILSSIKNKLRRRELYQQYKKEKLKAKKEARKQRQREYELLGDDAPPKPEPKTIENTREPDDTFVDPEDEEVKEDEAVDEMASYFRGEREPKVLITTSDNPHTKTIKFCRELMQTIPNAEFRWRNRARIKNIIANAPARGYTDIVVINEDLRKPNGLLLIHLPDGPTAYFRLSSVRYCKDIRHRASLSAHRPEVIINNFKTRLGHTVGRMIACLFHFDPQFHGRRVATFHNQRDYIFFRHHRYQFKNGQKVALQEIGPRFTLKLRWLQKGTFDTKYGEFEWLLKRHEMETSRRRFFL